MTFVLHHNFSLKSLNTFGIDVRTTYFTPLSHLADLTSLLAHQAYQTGPTLWLGGGSNLLFTQDFSGLVIQLALKGTRIIKMDDEAVIIEAAAGENWHQFVQHTLQQGWYGLENLSLIPGTVGACPIQNIGAYGVEVKEAIHEVICADLTQGGARQVLRPDACQFGYRDSLFKHPTAKHLLITAVRFRLLRTARLRLDYGEIRETLRELGKADNPTPRDVSEAIIRIRSAKLPNPTHLGNAGSFFKNPIVPEKVARALLIRYPRMPHYPAAPGFTKLAAGWLIDQIGLKGYREGDAGVHEQQALVLVNYGRASGLAIKALAEKIQETIHTHYGITLEPEPLIL